MPTPNTKYETIILNKGVIPTSTIIADCCANHKGNRDTMEEMIKKAAEIGVDIVKFQSFKADKLNKNFPDYENAYKYYKSVELSEADHIFILEKCKENNIDVMFTAFDIDSLLMLSDLGVENVKFASPDAMNFRLIHMAVTDIKFKNVFISLGMHYGYEIKKVIDRYLYSAIFLYCKSIYPCNYKECDYRAMGYIKENTGSYGISDHSKDSSNMIYMLNNFEKASHPDYIERHFKLYDDPTLKDNAVSSTPEDLARLTGYPFPELTEEELKNREKYINRWKG